MLSEYTVVLLNSIPLCFLKTGSVLGKFGAAEYRCVVADDFQFRQLVNRQPSSTVIREKYCALYDVRLRVSLVDELLLRFYFCRIPYNNVTTCIEEEFNHIL